MKELNQNNSSIGGLNRKKPSLFILQPPFVAAAAASSPTTNFLFLYPHCQCLQSHHQFQPSPPPSAFPPSSTSSIATNPTSPSALLNSVFPNPTNPPISPPSSTFFGLSPAPSSNLQFTTPFPPPPFIPPSSSRELPTSFPLLLPTFLNLAPLFFSTHPPTPSPLPTRHGPTPIISSSSSSSWDLLRRRATRFLERWAIYDSMAAISAPRLLGSWFSMEESRLMGWRGLEATAVEPSEGSKAATAVEPRGSDLREQRLGKEGGGN